MIRPGLQAFFYFIEGLITIVAHFRGIGADIVVIVSDKDVIEFELGKSVVKLRSIGEVKEFFECGGEPQLFGEAARIVHVIVGVRVGDGRNLNELGAQGWEIAEFQPLYDPDRGTSYIAIMKMAQDQ